MHANAATTLSIAAAAISFAVALLGSRLTATPHGRQHRFSIPAASSSGVFALCDAVIAGSMSDVVTVWAGRIEMFVLSIHSIAWMAFFAAWDHRPFSKPERIATGLCIAVAPLALIPGAAMLDEVRPRTVDWLGVTYHDPVTGFAATPIVLVTSAGIILAARSAYRRSRQDGRARHIMYGFVLYLLVSIVDTLSGLGVVNLPYFASLSVAIVPLSVALVVASKLGDSAQKLASQANELVRQAEELAVTRAALVERERLAAVGELAAVVAHEVRNPVAIIFNAVATLSRRTNHSEDTELLDIVRHEAERLTRLVVQLLDSVRPFELQATTGSVESIVSDAVNSATRAASVEPSEVVVDELPSMSLDADAVLLVQAISNLVSNAIAAPARRSPVRLAIRLTEDDVVQVAVTDDGKGVSRENEPRLFSPFFTTRATGTGLGLALVKRIAEAHGGSVGFERRDPGASFILNIPRRRPRPGALSSSSV